MINQSIPLIAALITCAGNGSRFGSNKLLKNLMGKPVFIRTIEQFLKVLTIDEIIIIVNPLYKSQYIKLLKKHQLYNKIKIVEGGKTRFESAYKGLKKTQAKFCLIHDGARPLIKSDLIEAIAYQVQQKYAVMLAVEAFTSIKKTKNICSNTNNHQSLIVETNLKRAQSWLGQTPQAYKKSLLLKAYQKALNHEITGMDDCELVSQLGFPVTIIPGQNSNLKITYPEDLIIVRQLYKKINKLC